MRAVPPPTQLRRSTRARAAGELRGRAARHHPRVQVRRPPLAGRAARRAHARRGRAICSRDADCRRAGAASRRDGASSAASTRPSDLARRLDPPVVHALWRTRATAPQAGLTAAARRRNVRDAFRLSPLLRRRTCSRRHRGPRRGAGRRREDDRRDAGRVRARAEGRGRARSARADGGASSCRRSAVTLRRPVATLWPVAIGRSAGLSRRLHALPAATHLQPRGHRAEHVFGHRGAVAVGVEAQPPAVARLAQVAVAHPRRAAPGRARTCRDRPSSGAPRRPARCRAGSSGRAAAGASGSRAARRRRGRAPRRRRRSTPDSGRRRGSCRRHARGSISPFHS